MWLDQLSKDQKVDYLLRQLPDWRENSSLEFDLETGGYRHVNDHAGSMVALSLEEKYYVKAISIAGQLWHDPPYSEPFKRILIDWDGCKNKLFVVVAFVGVFEMLNDSLEKKTRQLWGGEANKWRELVLHSTDPERVSALRKFCEDRNAPEVFRKFLAGNLEMAKLLTTHVVLHEIKSEGRKSKYQEIYHIMAVLEHVANKLGKTQF